MGRKRHNRYMVEVDFEVYFPYYVTAKSMDDAKRKAWSKFKNGREAKANAVFRVWKIKKTDEEYW